MLEEEEEDEEEEETVHAGKISIPTSGSREEVRGGGGGGEGVEVRCDAALLRFPVDAALCVCAYVCVRVPQPSCVSSLLPVSMLGGVNRRRARSRGVSTHRLLSVRLNRRRRFFLSFFLSFFVSPPTSSSSLCARFLGIRCAHTTEQDALPARQAGRKERRMEG